VDGSAFKDPSNIPKFIMPTYLEIDKMRQIRLITDAVAFLKAEEVGKDPGQYVSTLLEFKYLNIQAGTYHALSPKE